MAGFAQQLVLHLSRGNAPLAASLFESAPLTEQLVEPMEVLADAYVAKPETREYLSKLIRAYQRAVNIRNLREARKIQIELASYLRLMPLESFLIWLRER